MRLLVFKRHMIGTVSRRRGMMILVLTAAITLIPLAQERAGPAPDADRDGVADDEDRCIGTLLGASQVDSSGCPRAFDPEPGLEMDHAKHRTWYRHFWYGNCAGLSFLACRKFDGFERFVEKILTRVPAEQRGPLRMQLWALGKTIGHEWARDNDTRCIDTQDVFADADAWARRLEQAAPAELSATIVTVMEEVNAALSSPPPGRRCLAQPLRDLTGFNVSP